MYAGYPSGKGLAHRIYHELSEEEKQYIDPNSLLPDLTEQFVRNRNGKRHELNTILKNIYQKAPDSIEYHEKIASIPHFKEIITTNYDPLFEKGYDDQCHLILRDGDLPYAKSAKVPIYKIHGDLSDLATILITRKDYNRFFSDRDNSVYWSYIKSVMATKTLLFIGYTLEDPNVETLFDDICAALGPNQRESFFVAPSMSQAKIIDLAKKNITYIDSTGEKIIDELLENVNRNIADDLRDGLVSSDTFMKFCATRGVYTEIGAEENGFSLKSLTGRSNQVEGNLIFTLKDGDNEFQEKFEEFISGKVFGDFEVPEDKILHAILSIAGIKIKDRESGLGKLQFQAIPKKLLKFDINFGIEFALSDLVGRLYGSKHLIELKLEYKEAVFKIQLKESEEFSKIHFLFRHSEIFTKTKDEIEIYSLLKHLASGNTFTLHFEDGSTYREAMQKMQHMVEYADHYLAYFKKLKEIEDHYEVQFRNMHSEAVSNEQNLDILNNVLASIRKEPILYRWDGPLTSTIDFEEDGVQRLSDVNSGGSSISATFGPWEVYLHKKRLMLGTRMVEFLDPFIANLEAILNRKTTKMELYSRSKQIKIFYLEGPINELE